MKNNLFESEDDRNLWRILNAKFILEFQQKVNNLETTNIGTIYEVYSCMWISNNQLNYDEGIGKLRLSLEELLTFSFEDYMNYHHDKTNIIARKKPNFLF